MDLPYAVKLRGYIMTLDQITYLRLQRQGFIEPVTADGYEALFRAMSPVPTKFWIEPGTAPEIEHRCDFNDRDANDFARRMRAIVKGRFQGGNVGYVYQDELPLFAAAYKKPIKALTEVEEIILRLLKTEGPMNLGMMKEITGILNKDLSKGAQHLQKAFMLFEDQVDKDNDRAWFLLEDEFDEMDFSHWSQESAISEVIRRYLHLNVTGDLEGVKSFTKFTNKEIKTAFEVMMTKGDIIEVIIEGMPMMMLTWDKPAAEHISGTIPDKIYLLDNNDYLVKSMNLKLKKQFDKSAYKTLAYICIKGVIVGRLLGYFRFGPDDLEDVELNLMDELKEAYRDRILEVIEDTYEGEENYLKRYCGNELSIDL